MADVTDDTFEAAVVERSRTVPVVVDLWAPWCGPCRTLGPIIEKVIAETDGAVELAKVNIDENPRVGATFRVQSIPAVFALRDAQIVDSFIGALPEPAVRQFVSRLAPPRSEADELVAEGTEVALRQALELQPDHAGAVLGLAELLVDRGETAEALSLLARIPDGAEARRIAALARMGGADPVTSDDGVESRLDALLDRVREDTDARQEFLDVLEVLGAEDPRTPRYRRALTSRLF
ncbi:MAG: FIG000875: Thioredoxin domain-containing protein EC-YbbN [uncultured Acidimicrobiales bacterium]|uniref:FIG000875: Thioredoxin domain-containing protein EC-YbbN n=1 Tax=uncultured Acidimicrobiales bacterium TaxID=310071 RepID=A0A6J4J2Q1_9ACTN|nr:MAG: FIG000875: Thioredoxin domain-containing protein EC-YbbN [uncultured Acidimicrobiales bacterium]